MAIFVLFCDNFLEIKMYGGVLFIINIYLFICWLYFRLRNLFIVNIGCNIEAFFEKYIGIGNIFDDA